MNKEELLIIKSNYEQQIVNELSEALQIEAKNITAQWSFEATSIYIKLINGKNVNNYHFIYTDSNLTAQLTAYSVITTPEGLVCGIQSQPATIDLNTMNFLQQKIAKIFAAENTNDEEVVND